MSHRLGSNYNPFSERDFELLRVGAIEKSRSVVSRREVDLHNIVDVGEGARANEVEELMARLEQHGLRRVLAEHRPNSGEMIARDSAHGRQESTSAVGDSEDGNDYDRRVPYYYMCVPCELALTEVSTTAATMRMLQDAHYHFSSAEHRCIASWMDVDDISKTLTVTSELNPRGYIRIFVNGVPFLVTARPGGGDMFYPLPHETAEGRLGSELNMSVGRGNATREETWYNPLKGIFTRCKQMVFAASSRRKLRVGNNPIRFQRRNCIVLLHIPMKVYERDSFVGGPTIPALFEVNRERVSNKRRRSAGGGVFTSYAMGDKPIVVWEDKDDSEDTMKKITVREGGAYRLVLLRPDDVKASMAPRDEEKEPLISAPAASEVTQSLTVEALRMFGGSMKESLPDKKCRSYTSSSWSQEA